MHADQFALIPDDAPTMPAEPSAPPTVPDPWPYYRALAPGKRLMRVIDIERNRQAFVLPGPKCREPSGEHFDWASTEITVVLPVALRSEAERAEILRLANFAWAEAHPDAYAKAGAA